MITSFNEMIKQASITKSIKLSVAAAADIHVLKAVYSAYEQNIADAILVGDKLEITKCLEECGIDVNTFEIIHVDGDLKAQSEKAVELVTNGKAQAIMKGLVDTSILLRAVLNEKANLRTGRVMSSVGVIETPFYHKMLLITDPGMSIKPNLDQKKQIIENALQVTKGLGIHNAKVGVLCAKEKVNPKMPETVDAAELVKMNESGELSGCIVGGPFALDNIVSKEAAAHKGIDNPVAGEADIILAPEIVSGNTLYKALAFLSEIKSAGIIVGAKAPIILTSRADSEETKLNSIALAAVMSSN